MNEIVRTIDLTKIYRSMFGGSGVTALDGLNLEIKKGEIFGILGPNGSGKTTLIKLLLGLIFPTRGKASVFGYPVRVHSHKQKLGYMPEAPYFYDFLTPVEILEFYGKLFKIGGRERKKRIEELIELVGLTDARSMPLRAFSKGMLQRIGLASALINDPELLFLDEPTIGLDPLGARDMKDLFARLRRQGKTIILSSHLLEDVEAACDRVGILYRGKLIEIGRVEDILTIKDEVRIITGSLSPGAKQEIRRVVEKDKSKVIKLDHPRETLEDYFIEAVKRRKIKSEDSNNR